jgi:hypothetical protein
MLLYERRVLLESAIAWPRTVAVYRNVRDLPPGDEGNAVYVGAPHDITAILPFTDDGKVALSFNPGALGHEHFHAHFDAFVASKLPDVQNAQKQDAIAGNAGCARSPMAYKIKLLRSWNEGLADFYGAVTSEMPHFMMKSLQPRLVRTVDADPARMRSLNEIQSCQLQADNDPYYNGEQLSRALYAVAANDEFPALGVDGAQLSKWERAARYIIHRLSQFRDAIQSQRSWNSVPPEFALCFFLQDVTQSPVKTLALPKSRGAVNMAFSDPRGVGICDALPLF